MLQELAIAWAGRVKVVKVKVDDNLDLALKYRIKSVPTLICFIGGNPCMRFVITDASKGAILAKINLLCRTDASSS